MISVFNHGNNINHYLEKLKNIIKGYLKCLILTLENERIFTRKYTQICMKIQHFKFNFKYFKIFIN